MRYQAAIAYHQRVRLDALLDPGQESTHGTTVTGTRIADALRVHQWIFHEQVHTAAEILDQLNLLVAILRRE